MKQNAHDKTEQLMQELRKLADDIALRPVPESAQPTMALARATALSGLAVAQALLYVGDTVEAAIGLKDCAQVAEGNF